VKVIPETCRAQYIWYLRGGFLFLLLNVFNYSHSIFIKLLFISFLLIKWKIKISHHPQSSTTTPPSVEFHPHHTVRRVLPPPLFITEIWWSQLSFNQNLIHILHFIPTSFPFGHCTSFHSDIHCPTSDSSFVQLTSYLIILESAHPKQESIHISGYL
jgi:hypothetical protein